MESDELTGFPIRDFADSHFESLLRLWHESGVANPSRGDSLESIHATLTRQGRLFVIVKPAGAETGAAEEVLASAWLTDDGRRLYLHHMAVLPSLQGRGLGTRLMEVAIAVAAERGMQMKLEVHRENRRALSLYRRFGFDGLGDYEVMIRRKNG
ncbi:MAG TPA: N-acetyltransferase [Rectinemataceae bacterium]|nr:N-acetyltransferase [Rectinemataceae bacterium]